MSSGIFMLNDYNKVVVSDFFSSVFFYTKADLSNNSYTVYDGNPSSNTRSYKSVNYTITSDPNPYIGACYFIFTVSGLTGSDVIIPFLRPRETDKYYSVLSTYYNAMTSLWYIEVSQSGMVGIPPEVYIYTSCDKGTLIGVGEYGLKVKNSSNETTWDSRKRPLVVTDFIEGTHPARSPDGGIPPSSIASKGYSTLIPNDWDFTTGSNTLTSNVFSANMEEDYIFSCSSFAASCYTRYLRATRSYTVRDDIFGEICDYNSLYPDGKYCYWGVVGFTLTTYYDITSTEYSMFYRGGIKVNPVNGTVSYGWIPFQGRRYSKSESGSVSDSTVFFGGGSTYTPGYIVPGYEGQHTSGSGWTSLPYLNGTTNLAGNNVIIGKVPLL